MIVGPMRPKPSELAIGGASTRAISSQNMAFFINVAPRPPYFFGHETAAQRPSWSLRCQARKYGNDSSIGFSRHSFQSFGRLLASHARSSSRKDNSSLVKFKSMTKLLPIARRQLTLALFSIERYISTIIWLKRRIFVLATPYSGA